MVPGEDFSHQPVGPSSKTGIFQFAALTSWILAGLSLSNWRWSNAKMTCQQCIATASRWIAINVPLLSSFFVAKNYNYGGFLSHGGTPSHHPFLDGIFHEINHPAIGVPPWGAGHLSLALEFYRPHLRSWTRRTRPMRWETVERCWCWNSMASGKHRKNDGTSAIFNGSTQQFLWPFSSSQTVKTFTRG